MLSWQTCLCFWITRCPCKPHLTHTGQVGFPLVMITSLPYDCVPHSSLKIDSQAFWVLLLLATSCQALFSYVSPMLSGCIFYSGFSLYQRYSPAWLRGDTSARQTLSPLPSSERPSSSILISIHKSWVSVAIVFESVMKAQVISGLEERQINQATNDKQNLIGVTWVVWTHIKNL